MIKYLAYIILLVFVAGCSCDRYTQAIVADHETKEAIQGAEVYSYAALDGRMRDERYTYTNDTGWFETAFTLKSMAKCGTLKLRVGKGGYDTIFLYDHPPGDTIFLKKVQ